MIFSVSLLCPFIEHMRHACPTHRHLVTQMSLHLLETSPLRKKAYLMFGTRDLMFGTRDCKDRTEFVYSTNISQVPISFRCSGEYSAWLPLNMLNVWNSESGGHSSDPSSAANCVSVDSTKMITAWRKLSLHRYWSDWHSSLLLCSHLLLPLSLM